MATKRKGPYLAPTIPIFGGPMPERKGPELIPTIPIFGGNNAPESAPAPAPAPARPDPQNMDWKDSIYNSGESGITRNLSNLQSYLGGGLTSLGQNYGIQYDPAATSDNPLGASNFRIDQNVDVTNPFSRAALLKRNYTQAQTGDRNSLAAKGQHRSGAAVNAKNRNDFGLQQNQDSLLKDFQSQYSGLMQQWLQGQQSAEGQRSQNQNEAIARAIAMWQAQHGGG